MLKIISVLLVLGIILLVVRIVSGTSMGTIVRRHLGPLACSILGHRRDGKSVRKVEQGYQSRCRRCDARLVKTSREADWVVVDRSPAATGIGLDGFEGREAGLGHAHTNESREERGA